MIDVSKLTEDERVLLLEGMLRSLQERLRLADHATASLKVLNTKAEITDAQMGIPLIKQLIFQLGGDPEYPIGTAAIQ